MKLVHINPKHIEYFEYALFHFACVSLTLNPGIFLRGGRARTLYFHFSYMNSVIIKVLHVIGPPLQPIHTHVDTEVGIFVYNVM